MKVSLFIASLIAFAILALSVSTTVTAQDAATVIKDRKNHMKKINKPNIRKIMKSVKAGTVGPADAAAAEKIRVNMPKFMKLFPAGSGPGKIKTRAKDTIWSDFSGFQAKKDSLVKALVGFEAAAKSGNAAAADKAMRTVVSACNGCHKAYGGWRRIKLKK